MIETACAGQRSRGLSDYRILLLLARKEHSRIVPAGRIINSIAASQESCLGCVDYIGIAPPRRRSSKAMLKLKKIPDTWDASQFTSDNRIRGGQVAVHETRYYQGPSSVVRDRVHTSQVRRLRLNREVQSGVVLPVAERVLPETAIPSLDKCPRVSKQFTPFFAA